MSAAEERTLGPWTLHEKLGEGGNATVWHATRTETGEEVALKVIDAKKPSKEPYRRFVQEITVLRGLGDRPGVLPVLDAYLPEEASSEDRPWLAMPIATPIREALADEPLETAVDAVATVAETLAGLQEEHGIGHRDIKPDNLYERDGNWLIGDFGLVDAPDLEELTRSNRPLGPAHYTAYEMIADPANADSGPADVYSLGKTLWVLTTGQNFPPEGHQAAGLQGFSIADARPHPHADALDRLVDGMTQLPAAARPSMAQVARDLRAWRELAEEPPPIDVSEARARIRERLAEEFSADDARDLRREHGIAAVRKLSELTRPLNDALRQVHPRAEIDVMNDDFTNNVLRTLMESGAREIDFRWARCSRIGSGPDYHRYTLRMGRGIEVAEDGTLIFRAFIDVGFPTLGGNDFAWQSDGKEAPAGTVEAERLLEDAVRELTEQLQLALNAFEEGVARSDG